MKTAAAGAAPTWDAIDAEKRRDRFMRRINIAAWSITFVALLLYAIPAFMQVVGVFRRSAAMGMSMGDALWSLVPLVEPIGLLALLIAVLTTIGIFLRFRTASLAEIQLRLAALERMLASAPDGPRG